MGGKKHHLITKDILLQKVGIKGKKVSYLPILFFLTGCNLNHTYFFRWPYLIIVLNYSTLPGALCHAYFTDPEVEEWTVKAGEGVEEFQVKLGKHYLTLADSSVDAEENGKLAIVWLTKASKQGNDEATEALEKCLETKTGELDLITGCQFL